MSLFDILLFLIALFSVAVAVSAHLCIICHHFCYPMSLFQAHVTCRNLSLTWPHLSIPMKVSSCMIVLCPPFSFRVVLLCLFELLFHVPNRPRNG